MTAWDKRTFMRALGATLIGIAVVWLVTAASDEGHLTVAVRAGRALPLAPLCGAVGAALALGTARVREEARALEALGRAPGENARSAALGAALPSIAIGLALLVTSAVDVSGFYPRAPRGDAFVYRDGAFESASLHVRVTAEGAPEPLDGAARAIDDGLPQNARAAASIATALAGLALALIAARAALRVSLLDDRALRRRRVIAGAEVLACALFTLVAFQAAAARVAPAALAIAPPAALLAIALLGYRSPRRHEPAR
ncbi:MAG: hypothetical protein KF819_40430 [Labilithrix sp.]|nr:hypothetical protein [Labilithrix sp.]